MSRVLEEKMPMYVSLYANIFNDLPMKAKEIYFFAIDKMIGNRDFVIDFLIDPPFERVDECKSPIEKIFLVAFQIVSIARKNELQEGDEGIMIFPQFEIESKNKTFYADFIVGIERSKNPIEIVVECDGHEFHQKNKQQVERDNEREYEIKKAGYEVLRFSGSQIYNNPFKCANDVFDYLLIKEEREG